MPMDLIAPEDFFDLTQNPEIIPLFRNVTSVWESIAQKKKVHG